MASICFSVFHNVIRRTTVNASNLNNSHLITQKSLQYSRSTGLVHHLLMPYSPQDLCTEGLGLTKLEPEQRISLTTCSGQQIPDTDLNRFSVFVGDTPLFA